MTKRSYLKTTRFKLLDGETDPDYAVESLSLLPRDLVMSTGVLLPLQTSPDNSDSAWAQLSEDDRHAFRAVYHHMVVGWVGTVVGSWDPFTRAVVVWLRWLAVKQAESEECTWVEAYQEASERLQDTIAHAGPSSMKTGYASVQSIRKAQAARD